MAIGYRISKQHKAVLLPFNPAVQSIIPHAKTIEHNGKKFHLVPHRITETKLLNNLGVKVPAPILYHYDWCNTTPFESQKDTARLMTENRRAYVLNDMGCVDSDTEYLSPTGWVRIADYQGGEVAQYLPETRSIEFVEPEKFVKLPCETMVRLKTTFGIDQLLSPEHRVLLHAKCNPGKTEVVQAIDLYRRLIRGKKGRAKHRSMIGASQAAIPTTFRYDGQGLSLSDAEIRLMVAVKADGYFPPHKNGMVHVRLKKTRKKERLRRILLDAQVPYTEHSKDYPSAKGFTVFKFVPPERSKDYSGWWGASAQQLKVIADEFVHWGGAYRRKTGRAFFSRTKADADFIQFACSASGFTSRVLAQARKDGVIDYTVYVRNNEKPLGIIGAGVNGEYRPNVSLAPSTDGFKYCFTVPSTFLLFRRNGCIFASGNTGKTRAALYATDFMMKTKEIDRTLIVAPLSTLTTVWEKEIFECFPHRTAVTLHGTRAKRLSLLGGDFDYYIINHDGLRVLEQELKDRIDINAVIIDELAILRNSKSKRWKVANRIMQTKQYVWGMTGSPTPKEPTDAYGQAKLLTPERVPKFFTAFKNSVMYQVSQFKWLPRKEANNVVHETLQPAVRYSREDCIDLPPTTYSTREVLLTAAQKAAYKQMMEEYVVSYESGDISAANAGVRASKLVQIGAGFTYGRDGVVVDLDCDPRINELAEILNETEQKVIVFTPFKHSVDTLYNMLQLMVTSSVARIHGDVPKAERDKTFNLFQNSSDPRVLVAHPQTMAHGLTLTAANTVVWYSPIWDLEIYEQANARITRPGQKHHTHIIHIQATKTEERIYDTLIKRGNMQSALLGLFKGDRQ